MYRTQTLIGVFNDSTSARQAVDDLRLAGFPEANIRLIEHGGQGGTMAADDLATSSRMSHDGEQHHNGKKHGFFARLFGFDEDNETTQTRRQGAWSIDEEGDRHFSSLYQRECPMVVVTSADRLVEAEQILRRDGAEIQNNEASGWYEEQQERFRTMRLNEEQLVASKERVEAGEVRVTKEVITENKTIEVPVTREEVVIERREVSEGEGRPGSMIASDLTPGEEIRIPVSEEQIHVEKKVVPREEVKVSKREVSETEKVSDTVKREEARVAKTGKTTVRDRSSERDQPRPL